MAKRAAVEQELKEQLLQQSRLLTRLQQGTARSSMDTSSLGNLGPLLSGWGGVRAQSMAEGDTESESAEEGEPGPSAQFGGRRRAQFAEGHPTSGGDTGLSFGVPSGGLDA
eukprot:8235840-Karenia_brevis.AAC.1